jgi:hypothetical protein
MVAATATKGLNAKTHPSGHCVQLLRNERYSFSGYHDYRAAGVESRFTCTNSVDATIDHLRDRARLIALKNPWTVGRLQTHRNATALWIPDHPDVNELFREVFVRGTDFESGLAACHVDAGYKIVDQDVGVVKICAIRSKDKTVKDVIVTVSCSHVIGETTMVYALWGMLNKGAAIVELSQERVHSFRGNPISGLKGAGLRKFIWFLTRSDASPFGVRNRPLRTKDQVFVHCNEINMEWIEQQKKAHDKSSPGAPYISTQDIITSWFFNQWNTACVGVAYDMRSRVKALSPFHMGNYHEALILYPKEYCDPAHVRRVVASQGAWQPRNSKPGRENARSVGWITGWHSNHIDLNLPSAVRKNHFPLRDATGDLPITKSQPWLAIFKTSATQYAIWCLTLEEFKDMSALGKKIEYN